MLVENEFNIGQNVYLITDKDQTIRLVIGIMIRPGGIMYDLASGCNSSWHYEMELSAEKDVLILTRE